MWIICQNKPAQFTLPPWHCYRGEHAAVRSGASEPGASRLRQSDPFIEPGLYNRVHKPQMVLEPEPVDIYAANPGTQSKHKNGDKTAPPVALAAHGMPL